MSGIEKSNYAYVDFSLSRDGKVNNIPERFRDIPNHSDDSSAHSGVIQDTSLGFGNALNVHGGAEFNFDHFRASLGGNLIFSLSETNERNYTSNPGSSQDGEGAALTYVGVTRGGLLTETFLDWGLPFGFGIVPAASLEYKLNEKVSLGVGISYYNEILTSGWNRYSSREVKNSESLGDFFPIDLYLRYGGNNNEGLFFKGGIRMNDQYQLSDLGKESEVEVNGPSFFFGIGGYLK